MGEFLLTPLLQALPEVRTQLCLEMWKPFGMDFGLLNPVSDDFLGLKIEARQNERN